MWQPFGCYLLEGVMAFPDRIERTVELAHPPGKVWAALTTAEGLGAWFGNEATIDLRPGGAARSRGAATRRAIPAALASGGPATATDLAALLPIPRATSPMAGASLKPCPENPPSIDKFGAAGSGPTRPCPSEV